jgi:phage terminase large subunit-like protein
LRSTDSDKAEACAACLEDSPPAAGAVLIERVVSAIVPTALLKRLIEDPTSVVTRATTRDNANNLAPTFLQTVMGCYAGSRIGRQELEGEIVEDRPDALWSRALLEGLRVPRRRLRHRRRRHYR